MTSEGTTGDGAPRETAPPVPSGRLSRRALFGAGAVVTGAALGGAVTGHAAAVAGIGVPQVRGTTGGTGTGTGSTGGGGRDGAATLALHGTDTVAFHGARQAGILTAQQGHAAFVALDLATGATATRVRSLLRMLSDDAARLTAGLPPLGGIDPFPAGLPARLTVTFGFGPGLFDAVGAPTACPAMVRSLPAFATDRLEAQWGQSDLLLQVCADDVLAVSYAVRRLLRDAADFTTYRWMQRGFVEARGTEADGTTARNLMGMRDGSANESDPVERAAVVTFKAGEDAHLRWLDGGSQLVVRRMRIDLRTWDDIDPEGKDLAFGRRLSDGSPLNGSKESDLIDREARDEDGFLVVPVDSHGALSQARTPAERMLRRAYNYDDGILAGVGSSAQAASEGSGSAGLVADHGLIFAAYQADLATSFVPVQRRLAGTDALNKWATHVGSAVYAIPPGAERGSFVGATLFS